MMAVFQVIRYVLFFKSIDFVLKSIDGFFLIHRFRFFNCIIIRIIIPSDVFLSKKCSLSFLSRSLKSKLFRTRLEIHALIFLKIRYLSSIRFSMYKYLPFDSIH